MPSPELCERSPILLKIPAKRYSRPLLRPISQRFPKCSSNGGSAHNQTHSSL
ncbi:hypothetical protein CEXT_44001, partial [Caerostris extrusa]